MNCTACQDLLLDYLYDLLDESQAIAVREHAASCPACAAELERAKSDQLKLGRAALAIVQVPEFEMPEAATPAPAETSPAPTPAPTVAPTAPARRSWPTRVAAMVVTLACCVLVAILYGWNLHEGEVNRQIDRVAQLGREQHDIATQLAALGDSFGKQQQQLVRAADSPGVQLHVAGAGRGVPHVSAPISVALIDLNGKPAAGQVDVEFVDAENRTLARQSVDVQGSADVPMPEALSQTRQNVRVRVTARAADREVASLEQEIAPPPQERAAHLAVNKHIYKAGDRVQVRALVLDRATLKPVPDGAGVRAAIVTETGQDVVASSLLNVLAGVAATELVVPAEASGDYFVEIRGDDLLPVRRSIEVLPAAAPTIDVLAQKDNSVQLQARNADGTPAANTTVTGTGNYLRNYAANDRQDRNFEQSKQVLQFKEQTDKEGKFRVQLPPTQDAPGGQQLLELNVAVGDAAAKKAEAKNARARYVLNTQPTRLAVDFYPEGGMLVAGVPNRVFFLIRAAEGDAPAGARIAVRDGDRTIYRSLADESLGVFTITPKVGAKEGMTLQFASPKQPEQRVLFSEIGIASGGVLIDGLSVQTGGGPLHLTLKNQGEPRLVQLVVTCRSEVVAHRRLELKGEPQTLDLPVTVDGVLRVTAFHVQGGDLVPLAERLIYRAPVGRLDLDVQLGAKIQPPPGPGKVATKKLAPAAAPIDDSLYLNIRGRNETGDALPVWVLASIVDDRFLDGAEPSLSAHFLLLGDNADWSDSPLLGLDSYRPALENALGVFGWRRLAGPAADQANNGQAAPPAAVMAKVLGDPKAAPGAAAPAAIGKDRWQAAEAGQQPVRANAPTATFFYRVAPSVADLRKKQDDDFNAAQLALVNASKARQAELLRQDAEVRRTLGFAQTHLRDLQDLPRERFMVALGVLTFGLMVLASLGIIFGLVQLARRSAASPAFCLAAGCLAGCFAVMMFHPEPQPGPRVEVAEGPRPAEFPGAARPARPAEPQAQNGHAVLALKARERADVAELDRAKGKADPRAYLTQLPTDDLIARHEVKRSNNSLRIVLDEAEKQQTRMPAAAARGTILKLQNLAVPAEAGVGGFGNGSGGGIANTPVPPVAQPPLPESQLPGPPLAPPSVPQPKGPAGGAGPPPAPGNFAGGRGVADKKIAEKFADKVADNGKVNKADQAPIAPAAELERDEAATGLLRRARDLSEHRSVDLNQLQRQFAPRRSHDVSDPVTVLWIPALSVPAAGISLPLDLPSGSPRFRVTVFGHTDDGRLGLYDGILEVTSERR